MLSTIWLLANKEAYRSVAERFDLGKGSLHGIVMNVCNALSNLMCDIIKFPQQHEFEMVSNGFRQKCGFPGVIGAIDGTYIPIPGPSQDRDSYICRKGFPAVHLQVVCDSNLKFLDIYAGWPASVHDARAFRNSPLKRRLEDGYLPPEYHLIGDCAYSTTTYLMSKYRDNGSLSNAQKKFNKCLSSTRVEVERAIRAIEGKV